MSEEVRKIPHPGPRVETGPVEFGDDWPGTFIRGDDCANYALHLKTVLDEAQTTGHLFLSVAVARGLLSDLQSSNLALRSEQSGSAQSGVAGAAARAESTAALSLRADACAADLRWTLKHLRTSPMQLADIIPQLQDCADLLEQVARIAETVEQWAQAYPLDMFPEPDFKLARELLERGGVSLDCVSASNMRHVITRVHELMNRGRQ